MSSIYFYTSLSFVRTAQQDDFSSAACRRRRLHINQRFIIHATGRMRLRDDVSFTTRSIHGRRTILLFLHVVISSQLLYAIYFSSCIKRTIDVYTCVTNDTV